GNADGGSAQLRALQLRKLFPEMSHEALGSALLDFFIVMPRIVVTAVRAPMLADDVDDTLATLCEDVEPQQNRPHPVLLAHVIGSGAGALLPADGRKAGIQEIAEEFPPRGRFEAGDSEFGCDAIGGAARRHRARDAGESLGIAGCEMRL